MNRSGLAVKQLVEYYRPETRNIMVIHDDLDQDVGRMKIVRGGGAGGHHGVESMVFYLKTEEFNRIKIGIGRPRNNEPIELFVLSAPYTDQKETIEGVLRSAAEAVDVFIRDGVESAMTTFNSRTMIESFTK
jgi:PTH1 family peptidyl-tRNA hydrolase